MKTNEHNGKTARHKSQLLLQKSKVKSLFVFVLQFARELKVNLSRKRRTFSAPKST